MPRAEELRQYLIERNIGLDSLEANSIGEGIEWADKHPSESGSRWHSIAEEGLPPTDGDYLVRHKRTGFIKVSGFKSAANANVTPQNCCYDYWYDFPPIPNVTPRENEDIKWKEKQSLISDKESLQRGLEHNAFVELLAQPKHILADIEKKSSPPNEYYDALRNNDTEREEAAKQYVDSQVNIGTQGMCRYEGFLVGAEWESQHPSDKTIMLILNCIGYEEKNLKGENNYETEKRLEQTARRG